MDVSSVESKPTGDPDNLIPLLDEELSRLPGRYRSALVACELEGKSRRDAARELGIPEGTLSTHLARGRKLLRERLRRRGVDPASGLLAAMARPLVETAVPDSLMRTTVRVALAAASGAVGSVPYAVSSLAERVLTMIFLARITLIVAALLAVVGGTAAAMMLAIPPRAAAPQVPERAKAGPDDLPGRVVDKSGAGVAGVQIWAINGAGWTPPTLARTTTDGAGRFKVPAPPDRDGVRDLQNFNVFARTRDGRVGWLRTARRGTADRFEIELMAVGDVRGRLTDQDGRPIAGVEVAPTLISRTNVDYVRLSPEVSAQFRTKTVADGSFLIKGIPQARGSMRRSRRRPTGSR